MTFLATNGASSITFVNSSATNQITGGSRNLYATNVNVTFQGAIDISPTTANKDLGFRGNGDYTLNGSIVTANTGFNAGIVVDATGTVTLALTAAQSAALDFDRAYYDIEIVSPAGVVTRLVQGTVTLSREVTR
jgi:hypothetical protein